MPPSLLPSPRASASKPQSHPPMQMSLCVMCVMDTCSHSAEVCRSHMHIEVREQPWKLVLTFPLSEVGFPFCCSMLHIARLAGRPADLPSVSAVITDACGHVPLYSGLWGFELSSSCLLSNALPTETHPHPSPARTYPKAEGNIWHPELLPVTQCSEMSLRSDCSVIALRSLKVFE